MRQIISFPSLEKGNAEAAVKNIKNYLVSMGFYEEGSDPNFFTYEVDHGLWPGIETVVEFSYDNRGEGLTLYVHRTSGFPSDEHIKTNADITIFSIPSAAGVPAEISFSD